MDFCFCWCLNIRDIDCFLFHHLHSLLKKINVFLLIEPDVCANWCLVRRSRMCHKTWSSRLQTDANLCSAKLICWAFLWVSSQEMRTPLHLRIFKSTILPWILVNAHFWLKITMVDSTDRWWKMTRHDEFYSQSRPNSNTVPFRDIDRVCSRILIATKCAMIVSIIRKQNLEGRRHKREHKLKTLITAFPIKIKFFFYKH